MRAALVCALFVLAGSARAAMPARDPDWPCQGIKVPELSVGSIWSGAAIDVAGSGWRQDAGVAEQVNTLAQRRVPLDEARAAIAAFAEASGANRQDRLAALFAGLFETLSEERGAVLDGLDRYGRRQKQLADQVRGEAEEFRRQQSDPAPDAAKIEQLGQRLTWDTRVFEDRRQMISAACDVPNVIEQRLFALSRAIQDASR